MSQTLGQLIQTHLHKLKWNEAELARCTGLSETYIGMLSKDKANSSKRGRILPKPEVVHELSRCLEVSAAEILAAMGYLPQSELGDTGEHRLVESYRRLPPDLKEVTLFNLQGLARQYGEVSSGMRKHPAVLPEDDPRPVTHKVKSALNLPPQEKKSAKKEVKNGVGKKR